MCTFDDSGKSLEIAVRRSRPSSVRDISSWAANRSAMKENGHRETLAAILDTTRECVIVAGADSRISGWNEAARLAFSPHISPEGRRISEVLRDLDLHEAFRRALEDGVESEIRLETNGGDRKFDVHISPLDLGGEREAIAFFYETTRLDRLEVVR